MNLGVTTQSHGRIKLADIDLPGRSPAAKCRRPRAGEHETVTCPRRPTARPRADAEHAGRRGWRLG